MQTEYIKIRTDIYTKQQLEEFAKLVGLPLSTLVVSVMKQTMKEKRVLLRPLVENPRLWDKCMRKAEREYQAQLRSIDEGKAVLRQAFEDFDEWN